MSAHTLFNIVLNCIVPALMVMWSFFVLIIAVRIGASINDIVEIIKERRKENALYKHKRKGRR